MCWSFQNILCKDMTQLTTRKIHHKYHNRSVTSNLKSNCSSFITLTYFNFQHISEHIFAFVPSGVWVSIFRRSTNRATALADIHAQPFPLPHYSLNGDLRNDSQFSQHPSFHSCGIHVSACCVGPTDATVYYGCVFSPSNSLHHFLIGCNVVRPSLRMLVFWR